MKSTSPAGKTAPQDNQPPRRHRALLPRDRASEWPHAAAVSAHKWSPIAAAQHHAGTKFLRLQNCRAIMALITGLVILSLVGGVPA